MAQEKINADILEKALVWRPSAAGSEVTTNGLNSDEVCEAKEARCRI